MSDITDEMGGYMGDGSEFAQPTQEPTTKPLDESIWLELPTCLDYKCIKNEPCIVCTRSINGIKTLIAQQVKEARIDELQHIREFWGQAKDESLSSKPFNFVALSDIDSRVKELQEGKK